MDEMQVLRLAREAITQGDKAAGRRLLGQAIGINPRSETAWLWLSAIEDDPSHERECLERVLKINPNNLVARQHLEKLTAAQVQVPPVTPPTSDQAPITSIPVTPIPGSTTVAKPQGKYTKSTKIGLAIVAGAFLLMCMCVGVRLLKEQMGNQKAQTAVTSAAEAYGKPDAPKADGIYVVGDGIAPGKWRSTGTESDCYWARRDRNQNTLDNHFGFAGGTVTIRPTDYEVELRGCGDWIYVEQEVKQLLSTAKDPKEDGFYTVGVEIVSGMWKSTGTGDQCYWARLDGNQETLDNHFGLAGGTVTIRPADYEVAFQHCGRWEYVGP